MSFRCLQRTRSSFVSQRRWDAAWFCRSWVATFTARQFEHLWADVGETARPYDGHPLAQLNAARRGAVLQEWARQMLQRQHPNSLIEDAVPGMCVNGRRRNKSQAQYDFMLDGRKVEIKSSQLQWARNEWKVDFRWVKFPQMMSQGRARFDDLYLVLFSPNWLHLVKHDLKTGILTNGVVTQIRGHRIQVHGGVNNGWEESLSAILRKLCEKGDCSVVWKTRLSDSLIADLCKNHAGSTMQFYNDKPLGLVSPQLRGLKVQRLVRDIDKLLNFGSRFSECASEQTVSGSIRGRNCTSADWIRDGTRVECKHSQLSFYGTHWSCYFSQVKPDCFDELLLAIYSPRGLDLFKHNGNFGMSTAGAKTEACGMIVRLNGPKGDLDPVHALQAIEAKLKANNCPHIATILWDV